MSDIVGKLRTKQRDWLVADALMHEAADEIERLRTDLEGTARLSSANTDRAILAEARLAEADLVIQRLNSGAELQAIMAAHNETLARLAEAVEVVRALLDAYSAYFRPGNPWADKVRETLGIEIKAVPEGHDPTNPFAPRQRPQKSIRLMTDAERRAAGLDPNGGFDGPTGAD